MSCRSSICLCASSGLQPEQGYMAMELKRVEKDVVQIKYLLAELIYMAWHSQS